MTQEESDQFNLLKEQINTKKKELQSLKDRQTNLEKEISRLTYLKKCILTKIEITDHALIRYLERVYDLDLQTLKNEIYSEEAVALARRMGGKGKFPSKNGFYFIFDNFKIVSVVPS